jgi:hypothetical protein
VVAIRIVVIASVISFVGIFTAVDKRSLGRLEIPVVAGRRVGILSNRIVEVGRVITVFRVARIRYVSLLSVTLSVIGHHIIENFQLFLNFHMVDMFINCGGKIGK